MTIDEASNARQAIKLVCSANKKNETYDVAYVDYGFTDDGQIDTVVDFIKRSARHTHVDNNKIVVMTSFLNWNKIEGELQYPGAIKVTIIREARFTETAT